MMGASPSDGSSSSTQLGLPIRVRAMVSICCSPPDMRPPGRSRMRARLGKSAKSFSSVQAGAPSRAACRPTSRFSITVQLGEDAPLLRHVAEAEPRDAIGRQALDAPALEG